MIIQRSVAARDGFQAVVKVEHDLVERQFVLQHDARAADVFEAFLLASFFLDQFQNPANELLVGEDDRKDHRFFHLGDFALVRPARWIINLDETAIRECDLIAHAGGGGDELEVVLALQPLLDDFHVQQAEESASKAEPERHRAFRFEEER